MNNDISQIKNDIINLNGQDLKEKILRYHPYDVSYVLTRLDKEYEKKVFDLLTPAEAADILEYYSVSEGADVLEIMDTNKSSKIISNMELDDAVDIMKEIDDDKKEELIDKIDDEKQKDIIELAKYSEDEAASIMTDKYLSLDISMSVTDAMKKLVNESTSQEMIDVLFVLDKEELVGIVDLKNLIIARKNQFIKDIMDKNIKTIDAKDSIISARNLFNEYNLLALPVLDNRRLIGIITIDDAIDATVEDVSEDYDKMAGIVGDNSVSFKDVIKSRILWLIILLILSFITSSIMDGFSSVIASVTALVFFQSLVLDMGGNAGTQSLATAVIELSQGELSDKKRIRKYLLREFSAGLINSIILGICAFALSYVFIIVRGLTGNFTPLLLALVIGLSMIFALVLSNFLGALVPIVLFKLKIDPAVASGPFISTLNDIISVSIYYSLAYLILILGGLV